MAGLGDSSLAKRDKQAIGMFLSKSPVKDARFTIQKNVKLSERQNKDLEDLKAALGTTSDPKAIRWALDEVFELRGDEIREVAEKKKSIRLE